MANTILWIDDTPELPPGFAEELERRGHRLILTEDSEDALRRARSGEPDLVLLELLLVSCDGLELMEQLAAAPVPFVVVTRGERTPELYTRSIELGARDFLTKPVLASQLLASVEESLGRRAQAPVDASQSPPESHAESAPSGELSELPFPELLHRLHSHGMTGVLIVSRSDRRTGIQLRNGSPVAASSSAGKEPLQDFLLRSGRIRPEQHERLVERLAAGWESPQQALVGLGLLGEEEIAAARRQRAEELLLEAFCWTSGSYRVLPGKRLKTSTALECECSAPSILFEGVLHGSPPEVIEQWLQRCGSLYISECETSERAFAEVELTAPQKAVLEELQGDRTLAELSAVPELDERLLYALALAGFLELHAEPMLMLLDEVSPDGADAGAPPEAEGSPPALEEAPETLGANLDVERRVAELTLVAEGLAAQDDFAVLEVQEGSLDRDVRRAYEAKLEVLDAQARPHDDPRLAELLERIRARVGEAYQHLADAESRRAYGALRRKEERDREAAELATRALEAESWFRKGERFLEAKQYDKAVEAFGMSAHLDAEEGEYLAHLGYALYLSRPRNELVRREAMEHIAKGIKLSSDRSKAYVYLGRIFKAIGDVANARKMFNRAVKVDPDCHPALQELRLLEMRKEKGRSKGLLGRMRGR